MTGNLCVFAAFCLDSLSPMQHVKSFHIFVICISFSPFSEEADASKIAAQAGPPKFQTQFNAKYSASEGQSAHLEARLSPAEDPNLEVEWLKDGQPIPTGHRFRTFHDFGIVILDILYCYSEDSGKYECRATNKLGTDSIFTEVDCSEKSGLILTPQASNALEEITVKSWNMLWWNLFLLLLIAQEHI